MWSVILTVSTHHGEADPTLLAWIKNRLDHLLGLEPWTVVVLIGLLILAMPVGLSAFYLIQQWRAVSDNRHPRH